VGCGEPSERIPHHILRVVNQFLHVRSTVLFRSQLAVGLG
jgi:hypothetical protein